MAGGFELTTPCSQSHSSSTAPPGHSYKIKHFQKSSIPFEKNLEIKLPISNLKVTK